MKNKRLLLIIIVFIIIVPVLFYIFSLSFFSFDDTDNGKRIPDAEMKEYFIRHYDEFEVLKNKVEILVNKGLNRVDVDWTIPENYKSIDVEKEDIKNIRKEMKKLNIVRGYLADHSGMEFITYADGLSVSGGMRGYYYSTKTPTNYFKNIDKKYKKEPLDFIDSYTKNITGSFHVYMRIKNNWYIFEQYED